MIGKLFYQYGVAAIGFLLGYLSFWYLKKRMNTPRKE